MRNEVHSPLQEKLLAALFGIKMAKEKNFQSVLIKMDSKVAVTEISKKSDTLCPWGSIIADICSYFSGNLDYSVSYVPRGRNFFAHNLAQLANEGDVVRFWWRETPPNFCNPDQFSV